MNSTPNKVIGTVLNYILKLQKHAVAEKVPPIHGDGIGLNFRDFAAAGSSKKITTDLDGVISPVGVIYRIITKQKIPAVLKTSSETRCKTGILNMAIVNDVAKRLDYAARTRIALNLPPRSDPLFPREKADEINDSMPTDDECSDDDVEEIDSDPEDEPLTII